MPSACDLYPLTVSDEVTSSGGWFPAFILNLTVMPDPPRPSGIRSHIWSPDEPEATVGVTSTVVEERPERGLVSGGGG